MRKVYIDYILEESYIALKKGGFLNIIAISTITITLFIFGVFLLLTQNLQLMLQQWKADIHLIVFFQDGESEKTYRDFAGSLGSKPGIRNVSYISQESAREFMTQKGYGFLLEKLGKNPLPASLEINFDLDNLDADGVQGLINQIEQAEIVESTSYGGGFFESLTASIWILKTLGIFLIAIYAIASVFIIATTIRLTVYTRQDEITIMRLVGATSWFVRWPYLLGGILLGLIGSLLSVILLFILYHFVVAKVDMTSLEVFGLTGIVFFEPQTILIMVCGGIIVGCLGTVLSLRKIVKI